MFDSYNEYLTSFKNKLNRYFGESFVLNELKEKVDQDKLSLSLRKKHVEAKKDNDYQWVTPLALVIEKILSIASNPRSHIKAYKDIKNVDVATRIDNKDIVETIKVPKFWKPLDDEMLPEYIFCDNYDMELAIYENRFMISLIDLLNFFLILSIHELYSKVKFIGKRYSTSKVDIALVDQILEKNILTLTKDPYALLLKKVIDYKKKLSVVFSSTFYKEVKKSKPLAFTDIHATNMLLGDASYSVCFAFYRKYLTAFHKNEMAVKKNKYIYYDYVLINLLLELEEYGFSFSNEDIYLDDSYIKPQTIKGKDKYFNVSIDKYDNQIVMTFIYRHRDVNKDIREEYTKKYISKVSIDVIATYPLGAVDDDDMNKVFKDTLNIRSKENYDNSYIVTSIDMNTSLNVIYVSPLNKKVDSNLKTLIRSLLVVNKGDKYIYSHLCPICGSHITPIDNEGEYKCPICSSTYSLFKKDNNNDEVSNVWFKKVNSKPNIE